MREGAVFRAASDAAPCVTEESSPKAWPIGLDDVSRAARALRDIVTRTPLLENADVNERLGGRLLIKAECAQRTGAFKLRGAYWRILNMSDAERARGAVTYSSGNHALGVARAAQLLVHRRPIHGEDRGRKTVGGGDFDNRRIVGLFGQLVRRLVLDFAA